MKSRIYAAPAVKGLRLLGFFSSNRGDFLHTEQKYITPQFYFVFVIPAMGEEPLYYHINVCFHLCAHLGQTGQGEPTEDGEINEMTLDLKFEPWWSEPEHATSRHGGSPQY